jgi:hypothetical protein
LPFNLRKNYYLKYIFSIVSIIGGYIFIFVEDYITQSAHKTVCLFKLFTGIPCPGCGMGRASLSLLKGNILSSFDYNILCIPFTIVIIISLIWLFYDLVQKKETFFPFIKKDLKTPYKIIVFSILIASWIVNIIRHI